MGNPSFASTNDVFLVFDLIDSNAGANYITGVNLHTGSISIIEDNGTSVGFPEYSPDDSRIVFQRIETNEKTLLQIAVDSTKIVPTGAAEVWISQGSLPTWFTIADPVGVDEPEPPPVRPETWSLSQNYPNPFNPVTEMRFHLPAAVNVKFEIFNIAGQKVATLANRRFKAGEHTVEWYASDFASGIYLYRISAGNFVESKKMVLLK